MRESLKALCDSFIANRDVVKEAFRMESSHIYAVCANIFCARGIPADVAKLTESKALIRQKTGIFSSFRGIVRPPIACLLAVQDHPSSVLEQTLNCYDLLKKRFWGSEYLALLAFLLADMTKPGEEAEIIARGRIIYERMKAEHPFLTSTEDSIFAVLMAFSPHSDDELIADMETCYQLLRQRFPSGNALQAVSHVLALSEGMPEEKTRRLVDLYDAILAAGGKYGKRNELATLAAVSILRTDVSLLAADMMEVDAFLSSQKGYGILGMDKRSRMMHAAMIVSDEYMPHTTVETAAIASTISIIAAQQAAMCAAIAASAAASTAANASN